MVIRGLGDSIAARQPFSIAGIRTVVTLPPNYVEDPFVDVDLDADMRGTPNFQGEQVVASWVERLWDEEMDGDEFLRVLITFPAGCFTGRRTLAVGNFARCGGTVVWGIDRGIFGGFHPVPVPDVDEVLAEVRTTRDGATRLAIRARFVPPPLASAPSHTFFGLLGGAFAKVEVGSEGVSPPRLKAITVSGVDPQPF